jgi:tetratricopeptide (TPR) repeat protein
MKTGSFTNQEYGFLLVELGDIDGARETFELMLALESLNMRARGHRSLALLEMYRGKHSQAMDHLEQAVLLNRSANAPVSEMRDRLYLATVLRDVGREEESAEQVDAARRLQGTIRMGPSWLFPVAQAYAQIGGIDEAEEILGEIEERMSDAAVAASVNRMRSRERAYPHLARGEIELARGDTDAALAAFELAATFDAELSREPLARCHRLRGETEAAIALYEELRADCKLGYEYQNKWIEAHYHLGRLYEEAGEHDKAMDAYAALLDLWSEADPELILAADARRRLERR